MADPPRSLPLPARPRLASADIAAAGPRPRGVGETSRRRSLAAGRGAGHRRRGWRGGTLRAPRPSAAASAHRPGCSLRGNRASITSSKGMACMQAHEDQKVANLMMLVHVTPMDAKVVVEEVQGLEMVHHMEEADQLSEAMFTQGRISLTLMENMFTGMIQIYHQEKAIGYARIQIVEISILLGALTVTTATNFAMQRMKHMSQDTALAGVILAPLHEGLQGWVVHLVTVSLQEI